MNTDTIAAIATPFGSGGIGIIKISGENALTIAASIFQRSLQPSSGSRETGLNASSLTSHRLYHGHIINPVNRKILDETLLSVMFAPHTYTKEDVVEINTHSGRVVLASILELVLQNGARLAEPGEFTKRAFLNGRIDLTQAEAVIDIINSKTDKALEIANSQLKGHLKNRIETIRSSLLHTLTEIEAALDFPEDVGDILNQDGMITVLKTQVIDRLQKLVDQYESGKIIRDGLKMVIVGRPNVGKSSLMNRLIQEDRAIVTPVPGTTRDLIEETLNIRGIPIVLADTAGLHETDDPVEVIGINKTKQYIEDSDLILFMVEAKEKLTDEDCQIYHSINNKRMILVINKSDLVADNFALTTPDSWKTIPHIKISALYGNGLSMLRDLIFKISTGDDQIEIRDTIIPNLRHKITLDQSLRLLIGTIEEIQRGTPFELIAIDIQETMDRLGEIIGITLKEDVINQIFSRFCIGK